MTATHAHIASICHEANKTWCEIMGDFTQVHWRYAPDWQRTSAINGVKFVLENPLNGDSSLHDNWMDEKLREGWAYGDIKNSTLKQHPCLVPFNQLPRDQQIKDKIFRAIVLAFRDE